MIYSNQTQIGVIACPGGEYFAREVIHHLKDISIRKFKKRISYLSRKYSMPETEIIKKIHFNRDITYLKNNSSHDISHYPAPKYGIRANFYRFANGEFKTEIHTSIRGRDMYIIQDIANHCPISFYESKEKHILSINDHIFNLFVTVDAVLQAGAGRITIVIPLYPYSRQHRKKSREGLTAARFGQMMEYFGIERIITLDIHSKEIENSFNKLRLENLRASYQILKVLSSITDLDNPDLVIVAPDTGAVDRNKFYARTLGKPLGMIYKERDYSQLTHNAEDCNITNMTLLGSVQNKTVFMCDDMLGTGGTIIKAIKFLKESGAREIICAVSLPLFNGQALQHFDEAYKNGLFNKVIGTNAVYHTDELLNKEWYISANLAPLFAKSIYRLHYDQSLSSILDNKDIIEKMFHRN
ncbi:MAG: ribose-phosphate diphosphokinase [Spirochaetales bacterium]|nr:ribose-phosphate diphosphokinase [Spirochaetales bacterium]